MANFMSGFMPGEWNWMKGSSSDMMTPTDDATAQLILKRRLAQADALRGAQMPQAQMVSGHYVAPSWTQYLANAVGQYKGRQQEREAMQGYGDYQAGKQRKMADLLAGKEVETPVDYNEAGNMPGMTQTTRQPYNQQEFMSKVSQIPEYADEAIKAQINKFGKNTGVHTLPAGGVMIDDQGNVIYENPKAPSVASQKPFVPPMQTYVSEGQRISERWNPETKQFEEIGRGAAYKPTVVPQASLSPADLNTMAEQAITGDKSVFTNIGRGVQGSANLVALRSAINKKLQERGLTGADLAAANAEFAGITAAGRSVATKAGNIAMAATEAEKVMPLALAASDKVVRSGFLPFGKMEVMFNAQTNNPALREFATANNALVNIYSRAISPTGNPTVSDKEHARELLSTAYDQKSYNAIVMQMKKEIEAAMASPQEVRKQLRESITGPSKSTNKVIQFKDL